MKIRLLSVGKPRDEAACALHDRYAERIRRFGVTYTSAWVKEVPMGGRYSDEHVLEREADLLAERLENRGRVVALDRGGSSWDSRAVADRLEAWASPAATFLIGGPLGLHSKIVSMADARWSLSALTLPHELARVVVSEQLYRAMSILRGLPYHK